MNLEEQKKYLEGVYMKALASGLCHNRGEWAALLGLNRTYLSSAMNGKDEIPPSLFNKVKMWAQINGLEEGPLPAKPQAQDIVIPAATAELYNNLSETVRIQAETISRLQDQLLSKKPESVEVCRKLGIA